MRAFILHLVPNAASTLQICNSHADKTINNKMAYSTIPVSEEPLVAKPQGKSIKALVVGAAVASFVLGALAATVVTSSAPRAPAALYEHEAQIKMELFPNKCVAVDDGIHAGAPLKIENCKDTHRQAFVGGHDPRQGLGLGQRVVGRQGVRQGRHSRG